MQISHGIWKLKGTNEKVLCTVDRDIKRRIWFTGSRDSIFAVLKRKLRRNQTSRLFHVSSKNRNNWIWFFAGEIFQTILSPSFQTIWAEYFSLSQIFNINLQRYIVRRTINKRNDMADICVYKTNWPTFLAFCPTVWNCLRFVIH